MTFTALTKVYSVKYFCNTEAVTSSAVNVFVHAIRKRSKKCLAQKVGHLDLLGPIPMIQPPFCSSCVALQYEPGMKFFHRMVPVLHAVKVCAKISILRMVSSRKY